MTDNQTIKQLCKLLEERGLGCQMHYLHASWCVGPKLYEAMDNLDGTLTVDNLTPEQAIAVTLGSEKCEPIVRCKDCKYFDNSVCYRPDGDGDYARWAVEPNGFCAWSARRWSDE